MADRLLNKQGLRRGRWVAIENRAAEGSTCSASTSAVAGSPLALMGLLALALAGCPGNLENQELYINRASGGASGSGTSGASGSGDSGASGAGGASGASGTGSSGAAATPDCVTALFTSTAAPNGCSQAGLCHGDDSGVGVSGLDLRAPFESRLINQPSKHLLANAAQCPSGDLLIDTQNTADSWLLKKVANMQGMCGAFMPYAAPTSLMGADLTCVQDWVTSLAGM